MTLLPIARFVSLTVAVAVATFTSGCLDGHARVSPRAAWHHELDMPTDDEFAALVPDASVQAAAREHETALSTLGLVAGHVSSIDDVLAATSAAWPALDPTQRTVVATFFTAVFEHGRDTVLERLDRRLDDIEDDTYISVDVADFVDHGPERATASIAALFDQGVFEADVDHIIVETLRASRVQVIIAVYIGDVDSLLSEAGVTLANPTAYVAGSVLRSVGARTQRPGEDLEDDSSDVARFEDEFHVDTSCVDGQVRLDWIDAYEIRLRQERAPYPHAFGSAWLVTQPETPGSWGDDWLVLDKRQDLLDASVAAARCGVALSAPKGTYEGTDITPYVLGAGFTVELRLTGLHAFAELELASRAQIMLEIGD